MCYVCRVLLDGWKTLILRERESAKIIEDIQVWIWKRMKSVKWIDCVSDDVVLNTIMENRILQDTLYRGMETGFYDFRTVSLKT